VNVEMKLQFSGRYLLPLLTSPQTGFAPFPTGPILILLEREPTVGCRTTFGKLNLFRRMASSGMLHRVALVRTDVSQELSASFIRVTRIGELGTTLGVTSNRLTLRRNTKY
jgi:hypothetical protein